MQELIDYLNIQLHLTPQSKERLKSILSERNFKKGDVLSCQKELDDCLFFIQNGGARVYYQKEGKDITYSFAFDKELLLSIRSKNSQEEYPEFIEFLEDTKAVAVHRNPFTLDFETSNIHISSLINRILLTYYHFLEERVIILQHKSARERYEWVVKRYPRLLQRATLGQIASFLGITKETLYRIRSGKYAV